MKTADKIRKYICVLLTALFCLSMTLVAFAGSGDGNGNENVNVNVNESGFLFDYEGIFSYKDAGEANEELSEASNYCGFPFYCLTAESFEGKSAEDFADEYFYTNGLGTGKENDGALLLISMGERQVYIYTHGIATRYFTDSTIEYIFDSYDGGLINALSEGDFEDAVEIFAEAGEDLYREGISDGQFNIDTESGKKDYYKKNRLTLFEIIVSAVFAAIIGALPVISIKKKYAMQSEKNQAQRFNLSYRANAVYNFAEINNTLIDKRIRSIPIPRPPKNNSGHSGGPGAGGFGGGGSSVSRGMGGSFHGGGGRSF